MNKRLSFTREFIAFLITVYLFEVFLPVGGVREANPNVFTLVAFGALNRTIILNTGEWYRLMTAPFLNGGVVGLVFSAGVLAFIGPIFEKYFGGWCMAAYVTLAALAGSGISFAFNGPNDIATGTAGIVSGICFALYIFSFRLPKNDRDDLQIRVLLAFAVFLWPIVNGIHHDRRLFNYGAHAGGVLTGIVFGAAGLAKGPYIMASKPLRRTLQAIAITGALLLACGIIGVALRYPAYVKSLAQRPITGQIKADSTAFP